MRRIGTGLLALAMLLSLAACGGSKPAPGPANTPAAPTAAATKAPAAPGETPAPSGAKGLDLEWVTSHKADFLRLAQRATMQAYDKQWQGYGHDDESLQVYYHGYESEGEGAESGLLRRAKVLADVNPDPERLREENGKVLYQAFFPQGEEWAEQWVELELGAPAGPTKTVTEGYVTATLDDNRVYLTFQDSEEALYYLCGYDRDPTYDQEKGREYPMPCDGVEVGGSHRFEVQGLYSNYTDLFLADLSDELPYEPYLFLLTADGGIEMVDVIRGFRYNYFCAMPIPGTFDLSKPIQLDAYQEGPRFLPATDTAGKTCDLVHCARLARMTAPAGGWSGSMDEVKVDGGSYFRVLNLAFEQMLSWEYGIAWALGSFNITEVDAETMGGNVEMYTLGMTGDGIVSALEWLTWEGTKYSVAAWTTGEDWTDDTCWETLELKSLVGGDPIRFNGEGKLTLYEMDWGYGATGVVNEAFADILGDWEDTYSGRCHAQITTSGPADDEIYVTVWWGSSAFETCKWTMTATYNGVDDAYYYADCQCKTVSYDANGEEHDKEVRYTDGTGMFWLENGVLRWEDSNDAQSTDCRFERVEAYG